MSIRLKEEGWLRMNEIYERMNEIYEWMNEIYDWMNEIYEWMNRIYCLGMSCDVFSRSACSKHPSKYTSRNW